MLRKVKDDSECGINAVIKALIFDIQYRISREINGVYLSGFMTFRQFFATESSRDNHEL